MPKGPQGQRHPADVVGNAVHIARIATREAQETTLAQLAKRNSDLAGVKARLDATTEAQRSEIEHMPAVLRWQ